MKTERIVYEALAEVSFSGKECELLWRMAQGFYLEDGSRALVVSEDYRKLFDRGVDSILYSVIAGTDGVQRDLRLYQLDLLEKTCEIQACLADDERLVVARLKAELRHLRSQLEHLTVEINKEHK